MLTKEEFEERSGLELSFYEYVTLNAIIKNMTSVIKYEDSRLINAIKHIHENVDAWELLMGAGEAISDLKMDIIALQREVIKELKKNYGEE